MIELTLIAAFVAGIISFLSPCILPLIPGFLAYLSGMSLDDNSKKARVHMFLNSVMFVAGFSSVFALLGVLLNTLLERSSYTIQLWLSRIGGVIIIFFGLSQGRNENTGFALDSSILIEIVVEIRIVLPRRAGRNQTDPQQQEQSIFPSILHLFFLSLLLATGTFLNY